MKLSGVDRALAARYMGVRGEPDDAVRGLVERAEKLVCETVSPKYVHRETDVTITPEGVKLGCMERLLTGNAIREHLQGCTRAVLLAATLSAEADKLIRQAGVRDMAQALAVDCVCSAAIEQVCDRAEEEIFAEIRAPFRTWRFSPGYGDLPIDLQADFLAALNAQRRIGLTATAESLLIPSKSVTALIGISDEPVRKRERGCAGCSMKGRCAFSASGRTCTGGNAQKI
ncbi:MAG: 5-methyltetrahydrofolate--homocysteine methyltransferase [Ruminococcus sp.]|nr:5-methyltetrahydrofolate--homocysteine methyltransferase [Ruminococcus sp.]